MSDQPILGTNEQNTQDEDNSGTFAILAQYLKDFSFESPNAPQSLQPREKAPDISVEINVSAQDLEAHRYEVILTIYAKALDQDKTIFAAELTYGGVFHIENIPQEHIPPLLFIECPRLLFPFARQILSDGTQQGGFPPLMLDPVDFAGLFQKRALEESKTTQRPN